MSRTPRSVEDGQFDAQTGNTDSQNASVDTQAVLDELEKLCTPVEQLNLEEVAATGWRKDSIRRIATRIEATMSDIAHFLKDPRTIRLISQEGSPEQLQRDYAESKETIETLKMAMGMATEDAEELSRLYLPGVDSEELGEMAVNVKKQMQALKDVFNRF